MSETTRIPGGMRELAIALSDGSDAATALSAAARLYARGGMGPGRLLAEVRGLYRELGLGLPSAELLTLAVDTWSHEARRVAAQPWCDPLTGLGTVDFFRGCLTTTYAGSAIDPAQLQGWGLLTVTVAEEPRPGTGLGDELEQGLRLGLVGDAVLAELTGVVASAALCRHRVAVLLSHDDVGRLLETARARLAARLPGHWSWRIDLRPLPPSLRDVHLVLDTGCECRAAAEQGLRIPSPRRPLAAS